MNEIHPVEGLTSPTVISPAPIPEVKKRLKQSLNDFIVFIREQGVVGLAIAFVLGGAVNKVVTSLVSDIIQPLIGLFFGSTKGLVAWHLGPIMIGNFLSTSLDFAIIAWVVYFIFKKLKLEQLDKKKA